MSRGERAATRRRAQALPEFALVIPVFCFLVFGFISLALTSYAALDSDGAARRGASAANEALGVTDGVNRTWSRDFRLTTVETAANASLFTGCRPAGTNKPNPLGPQGRSVINLGWDWGKCYTGGPQSFLAPLEAAIKGTTDYMKASWAGIVSGGHTVAACYLSLPYAKRTGTDMNLAADGFVRSYCLVEGDRSVLPAGVWPTAPPDATAAAPTFIEVIVATRVSSLVAWLPSLVVRGTTREVLNRFYPACPGVSLATPGPGGTYWDPARPLSPDYCTGIF